MTAQILQVLLIEDDGGDAILVERTLQRCRQPFALRHCESLEAALACLDGERFDVALLDLSLPDSFGLSALDKIRACAADIPIVVLTGLADDDLALQALEQGAQDYIVKGNTTAGLLERTLRYAVQRQQIQSENRRLLGKMEELARQDALTGVLNRHSFAEHLEREWKRAARHGRPLACVVLDIDFFKRVNDTFGHAAGDRALQMVADTLRQTSRSSDCVGRLGGEEFCVLLPETSEETALVWAERLRRKIAESVIPRERDDLRVTVSLGVAGRGDKSTQPQQLVDQADEAMFIAKQLGRDQVVSFGRVRELAPHQQTHIWQGVNVAQLMSPLAVSVTPCQSIAEAVRVMQSRQMDALPVLSAEGQLVGLIGEDDVIAASLTASVWERSVADLMQTQLMTFPPQAPAREVCEFLCRAAVRQVFVVDGTQPRGVICRTNFVRWLSRSASAHETNRQEASPPRQTMVPVVPKLDHHTAPTPPTGSTN